MSRYTKEKYLKVLNDMANQTEFSGRQLVKKHRVASNIITSLVDVGLILKVKQPGVYKWIANRPPTTADVRMIQKNLKARRLAFETNVDTQLLFNTIRKAPAPTPMPVVHEPDYDTSNSKMILIMAVGLVIGFLIATAIWK
jgi:hypothetical protein